MKSLKDWGCYQSQNYKIWKQFTTSSLSLLSTEKLLSITKLQNLKAIHNAVPNGGSRNVVINHKTTKFESNSQQYFCQVKMTNCCYQSQNYKIWKQFTTTSFKGKKFSVLLSITKLRNLKAIHNVLKPDPWPLKVVINHKTTKFESNSQLLVCIGEFWGGCYQSQNYKIWKQFTT